jgi:pilus assembly protein TadC
VPLPLVLDLLAAVLTAGAPVPGALRAVAAALEEVPDPSAPALRDLARSLEAGAPGRGAAGGAAGDGGTRAPAGRDPTMGELLATLHLSAGTGLPPVSLVRAEAARLRRTRRSAQAVAAQRLGVLLVLPTGLCLLPAFVFLTVAPLVLDLLG